MSWTSQVSSLLGTVTWPGWAQVLDLVGREVITEANTFLDRRLDTLELPVPEVGAGPGVEATLQCYHGPRQ